MKYRLGFISNSSASSFLIADRSVGMEKAKRLLAEILGRNWERTGTCLNPTIHVVDEEYMSDGENDHHMLPFLVGKIPDFGDFPEYAIYKEYFGKYVDLLRDKKNSAECRECEEKARAILAKFRAERQLIIDAYIRTEEFRECYKGMIHIVWPTCEEEIEDRLERALGHIGYAFHLDGGLWY
jgi:hypothetical protein